MTHRNGGTHQPSDRGSKPKFVAVREWAAGAFCIMLGTVLAACSPAGVPETTTTMAVATVTAPTSTAAAEISSADSLDEASTEVEICSRGTIWETEVTHVASCFLVPLAFTPPEEGWRSSRASLDAIEGLWVAPGEREPAIRWVALAYQPETSPDEVTGAILAIDGVDAIAPVTQQGSATKVDVETAPSGKFQPQGECVLNVAASLHLGGGGEPGYKLVDRTNLMEGAPQLYGLGSCRLFRIWVIPVDDITITVVATVDDLDRFEELMPTMQALVDTIAVAAP